MSRRLFDLGQVLDQPTNVNDPSAGSPTETLLRLLLPLNDQVWTSFRLVMASPPMARRPRESPVQDRQSEGLTKSFNR